MYAVRRIHGSQGRVKENGVFIGAMGDSEGDLTLDEASYYLSSAGARATMRTIQGNAALSALKSRDTVR